ncbi:MAG: hypothetical protein K2U26_13100 [Cyclobacteriaceae bacterium]|nr:hypothetical protein [Cyclobacteriaceae bacterium]
MKPYKLRINWCILSFLFTTLVINSSFAQRNTLDSLRIVLKNATTSSDSLRVMNLMTKVWFDRQLDTALSVNSKTIAFATKSRDTSELAMAYFLKAKLLAGVRRHDRVYVAYQECKKAAALLKNKEFEILEIWIESFANTLVLRTDAAEYVLENKNFRRLDSIFVENLTRCKDYYLSKGDLLMAGLVEEDIVVKGVPKYKTTHMDMAKEFYRKAHFTEGLSKIARYRAYYYWHREGYYLWYAKNFVLGGQSEQKSPYTFAKDDKQKAREFLIESENLARATGNLTETAKSVNKLAYCEMSVKNYSTAIRFAQEALNTAYRINDVEQVMQYQQTFYDAYIEMKQGEKAIPYIEKYLLLKDSIIGRSSFAAISEMETRNKVFEQEREMQQLKLSEIQSSGQRLILQITTVGLVIILILIVFIFWNRQRYLGRIKDAEIRQRLHEQKEGISRDLHDSLGGQLSSISIGVNRLSKENNVDSVQKIQELADNALIELRHSLWVMDKESITIADVEQRINNLFWQYRKIETPIDLRVEIEDALLSYKLKSDQAGPLYRIIQEATHNSVKHSQATHFRIAFEKIRDQIQMKISDNGIGFDMSVQTGVEHYGMRNIKQRAEKMNAKLSVESTPEKGVKILLLFPI